MSWRKTHVQRNISARTRAFLLLALEVNIGQIGTVFLRVGMAGTCR